MVLWWAVSGLMEPQQRFRRVKGYREMPQVIAALEATINTESLDSQTKIA